MLWKAILKKKPQTNKLVKESITFERRVLSLLYKEDWKYCIVTNKWNTSETSEPFDSILEENSVLKNRGRCGQDICN